MEKILVVESVKVLIEKVLDVVKDVVVKAEREFVAS